MRMFNGCRVSPIDSKKHNLSRLLSSIVIFIDIGFHAHIPRMKSIGLCFLLYLHTAMEESILDLAMEVSFTDRISEMSSSQVSQLICKFSVFAHTN